MITVSIYDQKQGKRKTVGGIKDGVYVKIVNRSKHFLRNLNGYAIDNDIVKALKDNAQVIRVEESGGDVYTISYENFVEHGIPFNWGAGPQIACPLKFWRKETNQLELL